MRSLLRVFPHAAFGFGLFLSLASFLGAAEPGPIRQTISLNGTWLFQRDGAPGTVRPAATASESWKSVSVPSSFQEHAWYRLWVEIPQHWQGREVFLSFEGVDDMYELYINGHLAGKGGDLATRKDTLGEKKSYPITPLVQPGQQALIAVRVHDWYGAGGIYRPVTLGTQAFHPQLDLLK